MAQMKFTAWTYFVAKRRSVSREAMLWSEHMRCFRGPEAWEKQMRLTNAISCREMRER